MKVYLHGTDGLNWSIDKDRENILKIFKRCGICCANKPVFASYIHTLWWNSFIESKFFYFKFFTKLYATCSNYVDPLSDFFMLHEVFNIAKHYVHTWLCPSTKQITVLDKLNLRTFYLPIFIDYEYFSTPSEKSKTEICQLYGIPGDMLFKKCVIGSFQRDSLGCDLSKPKFQKNPDGIINILKKLDRTKFILLLAGPRRHYIISQCKKYNIPYYYIGKECDYDDISINTCSLNTIKDLYSIIDVMLCTSVSEGGPKCILESSATKTFCISTNVGLAHDFLPKQCVSDDLNQLGKILVEYMDNPNNFIKFTRLSQENCCNKLCISSREKYIRKLYNLF